MRSSKCPTGRCSYKDHDDQDGDDADVRQLCVVMIDTKLTARPGFLKLETPHVLRCPSRTKKCRPCLHKQSEEIWDGGTQDGFEHHGSDICQCVLPLQLGLLSDGGVGLELVWQFNARKGSIIM